MSAHSANDIDMAIGTGGAAQSGSPRMNKANVSSKTVSHFIPRGSCNAAASARVTAPSRLDRGSVHQSQMRRMVHQSPESIAFPTSPGAATVSGFVSLTESLMIYPCLSTRRSAAPPTRSGVCRMRPPTPCACTCSTNSVFINVFSEGCTNKGRFVHLGVPLSASTCALNAAYWRFAACRTPAPCAGPAGW